MPITDPREAQDLHDTIESLLTAAPGNREARLRAIFVDKLDFVAGQGQVDLRGRGSSVESVTRIASAEGVNVVRATLDSPKVSMQDTRAISKALGPLVGDHLLVASNADGSLWHFIYPSSTTVARPVLRRIVLERDQPRRTAVTQLAKVYHEAQEADVRAALERAYDVEPVTKDFFTAYYRSFQQVMELMRRGIPNEEDRRMFCQTLFNRLMFIYFLQRKGWLRFQGDTDYLQALRRASAAEKNENFFRIRLCTLFFSGLNDPNSLNLTDGAKLLIGDVPFLNGGLFEKGPIDLKYEKAVVPNEAFGLIFDELFDRFNFTVSESTPYDIEVAVDPEMLGKVFEELVTGRHDTGSYYTPRSVVAFMCREALKRYLKTKTTGIADDAINSFVDDHDVAGLDVTNAAGISTALDEITVCDPACGSGAYLLGMLHELVDLQQALFSEKLGRDPNLLYQMKLHIIERNLYGADIDEFATRIAMLRLWLSLTIDFDGVSPPPLPNLDFKIALGNSLTAPDPQHASSLFRRAVHEAAIEMATLKARYLHESGPEKAALRRNIEALRVTIEANLAEHEAPSDAVDWRMEFAEVFDANSGFDVVLANPPYVSALAFTRTHTQEERQAIRDLYVSAAGAWDLYVPFFERGIQLLAPGGCLAYISPNKYLSASYASALRSVIRSRMCFRQLVDLTRFEVFESASVYPILTFLSMDPGEEADIECRLPTPINELNQDDPRHFPVTTVPQNMLDLLPDKLWGFLLSQTLDVLVRLLPNTVQLSQLGHVGATTTAAESALYGDLLAEQTGSAHEFRVVNTGTIDPYLSKWGRHRLKHGGEQFMHPVLHSSEVSETRCALYSSPKVLFAKIAKRCEAFVDNEGVYAGLNVNCFARPLRASTDVDYICGYANSRVFMFFYNQLFGALRMSQGYYQFQAPQLRVMPVLRASPEDAAAISSMSRATAAAFDEGDMPRGIQLAGELDRRFGELIGLSEQEFDAISPEGDWRD